MEHTRKVCYAKAYKLRTASFTSFFLQIISIARTSVEMVGLPEPKNEVSVFKGNDTRNVLNLVSKNFGKVVV